MSGSNICVVCTKRVYFNEKFSFEEREYHKSCFRCQFKDCPAPPLSVKNVSLVEGKIFCRKHGTNIYNHSMASYHSNIDRKKVDFIGSNSRNNSLKRNSLLRGGSGRLSRYLSNSNIFRAPSSNENISSNSNNKNDPKNNGTADQASLPSHIDSPASNTLTQTPSSFPQTLLIKNKKLAKLIYSEECFKRDVSLIKCSSSTIIMSKVIRSVNIDCCDSIQIDFEDSIETSINVMQCTKLDLNIGKNVDAIEVNNSSNCTIKLMSNEKMPKIFTSGSTDIKVCVPDEEKVKGEFISLPIAQRFVSTISEDGHRILTSPVADLNSDKTKNSIP